MITIGGYWRFCDIGVLAISHYVLVIFVCFLGGVTVKRLPVSKTYHGRLSPPSRATASPKQQPCPSDNRAEGMAMTLVDVRSISPCSRGERVTREKFFYDSVPAILVKSTAFLVKYQLLSLYLYAM